MMPLLETCGLCVRFPIKGEGFGKKPLFVHAVEDVSLSLFAGETLALVGESGSGKSTLGRSILKLAPLTQGRVLYQGEDISALKGKAMMPFRRHIQMVFQDPYSSLNPRMTAGEIVGEALLEHKIFPSANLAYQGALKDIFTLCGLEAESLLRYPHQFSGGQRQRIGIARALALNPSVLIADEAVSALDVSVKAQIIRLLLRLQRERSIACLFISHDLSAVRTIAQRVAVMYLGRIVELASAADIFAKPLHPYTLSLLEAAPLFRRSQERLIIKGEAPSNITPPRGCAFAARCPFATARCVQERPPLTERSAGRLCACWETIPS